MKQNKNSSVIRVLSFASAIVVLLASFSLPSFAYTDSSNNGIPFTGLSLPVVSSSASRQTRFDNGLLGYYRDGNPCKLTTTKSNDSVYAFFVPVTGTSTYTIYACAVSNSVQVNYVMSQNGSLSDNGSNNNTFNSQYSLYYVSLSAGSNAVISSVSLPIYSSLSDGLAGVRDFIDDPNPPPVVTPHALNTTLPAGNAIIIDVTGNSGQALSLSSSSALRHNDNWSDGNQMMGYFASAPSSLSSPFEGTHSITWRGTGSPNLFGGYNTWQTTAPLLPTGNYLVIVNPAYPNDNPDSITSNQASNGAINISCAYVLSAQIVPLSSTWSNGSIISSSGSLRLDGEYDPDTDTWTFINSSSGEPQNPVSGGMTDVDAEHITVNDWLQNISHQIGSFFSGAIGAVSTLVSAGSDFIHSLSGLYSWLPAPVYSVLVSALILVITIGVIKVFI